MRLITRFELATKRDDELHALLRECFNTVVTSKPHSHEWFQAMATMQNIEIELARSKKHDL